MGFAVGSRFSCPECESASRSVPDTVEKEGSRTRDRRRCARFLGAHSGNALAVREVSCDMSPAFQKGVLENLPNADVTFEKFYVTKVLADARGKIRRSAWRKDRTVKE